jgi:hypothetical protein
MMRSRKNLLIRKMLFDFWIEKNPTKIIGKKDISLRIKRLDRKNKTLVLHIKSKKPVAHFWLYCTQKGVSLNTDMG